MRKLKEVPSGQCTCGCERTLHIFRVDESSVRPIDISRRVHQQADANAHRPREEAKADRVEQVKWLMEVCVTRACLAKKARDNDELFEYLHAGPDDVDPIEDKLTSYCVRLRHVRSHIPRARASIIIGVGRYAHMHLCAYT